MSSGAFTCPSQTAEATSRRPSSCLSTARHRCLRPLVGALCTTADATARSQVGKSTLIKSLVKHYTRHNLSSVKGPITVVSGKQRRIQLVECGPELSNMARIS